VSELLGTLRAIVRDELSRWSQPELATVTRVFPRGGDSDKSNHQVSLRLRSSGVELPRVPVVVARLGLSALPNEGDLMLVSFVGGDLNAPVALGCLYDEQAHPPVAQLHEVVYQPPDEADSDVRRLHLELPGGATLTLGDEKLEITLGDTSVVVNKDGDLVIQAKGKIRLAAEGDLEIEAQGDLKLSAQGDVKVTAQGELDLAGMTATVQGQSQASLKAPQVGLAGMTQFSPS
jgi:uncharacterized protein involved in type VI secretion and phage assembly